MDSKKKWNGKKKEKHQQPPKTTSFLFSQQAADKLLLSSHLVGAVIYADSERTQQFLTSYKRVTEVWRTHQTWNSSLGEKLNLYFLVSLHWWSNKSANTDAHKHTYTHNASDKQQTRSQGLFTHANVLQRTHNRRAQESSAFTPPAFRKGKKNLSNVNGCFTAIKCYYVWRNKRGELWKYWYKLNFVKKKNEPGKEGESLEVGGCDRVLNRKKVFGALVQKNWEGETIRHRCGLVSSRSGEQIGQDHTGSRAGSRTQRQGMIGGWRERKQGGMEGREKNEIKGR